MDPEQFRKAEMEGKIKRDAKGRFAKGYGSTVGEGYTRLNAGQTPLRHEGEGSAPGQQNVPQSLPVAQSVKENPKYGVGPNPSNHNVEWTGANVTKEKRRAAQVQSIAEWLLKSNGYDALLQADDLPKEIQPLLSITREIIDQLEKEGAVPEKEKEYILYSTAAAVTNNYHYFWDNDDYFDTYWLLDQEKVDSAMNVLIAELVGSDGESSWGDGLLEQRKTTAVQQAESNLKFLTSAYLFSDDATYE